MDLEILKDLIMFLLPGGAIGSIVTWLATRRERKVDVLSKLQESIDLLTKKYTEVLDENVLLKADNAKLLANQKTLELKIDHLTEKVSLLTQQLNRRENGKSSQGAVSPSRTQRASSRSMRHGKQDGNAQSGGVAISDGASGTGVAGRKSRLGQRKVPVSESATGDDGNEGDICGTDTDCTSQCDDSEAEPPRPSGRGHICND